MTLPAIASLRKHMKNTHVALLAKPWVSEVFEGNPHIDEILLYSDSHRGIIGKVKLSSHLRSLRFCGAVLFQNAFDAALLAFLAGIKERAGYARDGRRFLLTHAVPVPNDSEHHIFYYLNLLREIGIGGDYSYPYIYLSLDERLQARQRLSGLKRPILGINPGATYGSAKRWFPERFAEVASWFIADTGGSAVLFGSAREVDIADEIYKNIIPEFRPAETVLTLAGRTSLRELISLVSECDVFLTNDSGPMHIAYAVRTPLVALFGSTDPAVTGPPPGDETPSVVIAAADVPCRPCFERSCKKNDMQCMYGIASDDVFYAIRQLVPRVPAVFFDRDGTLCEDRGYIDTMDELRLFPDVSTLELLRKAGFKLIGVSNQSGIGRGLVTEEFVRHAHRIFVDQFGFDDFYHCPHHPDDHCVCRKPEPEMLLRARSRHAIDLKRSFVVGDKDSDMLLAKAVGARGILVTTGKQRESAYADFTAPNLRQAVDWILKQARY